MISRTYLLGGILVIVVIAMVYLSIEGFYAYTSYSDYLKQKYGMAPGMDTTSMSASEIERRMEWTADNAPSASQVKLYDLIRKSGNLDEIRKLMKDPSAKVPKEWLTYFDDTDYEKKTCVQTKTGSECGYGDSVCTGSGSDYSCKIQKRTGSRLNTSANTRNPTYSNIDNIGGKYLTQCDSNDFNCIRNLTFADSNYRPYSMPTSDLFGAFDDSLTKPFPSYTPGTTNPTGTNNPTNTPATPAATTTPPKLPKTAADAIACMTECIGKYGSTSITLDACSKLCSGTSA
jgi:hypothetical protein